MNYDMNGEVAAIKFTTGEEVVSLVVGEETDYLILKRPLTLVMTFGHSEQGEVNFAPWMIGLDPDLELKVLKDRMIYVGRAREDAATEYRNATDLQPTTQSSPPPARGVKTNRASR